MYNADRTTCKKSEDRAKKKKISQQVDRKKLGESQSSWRGNGHETDFSGSDIWRTFQGEKTDERTNRAERVSIQQGFIICKNEFKNNELNVLDMRTVTGTKYQIRIQPGT
ncbi:hypothetical protein RUM43_003502 [Polyplax serrata]|uniref:Uncharacterized protein n=1 Tax=Polyplax serrata TaxID=468196 RepID=A0AAN8NVI7_POLSC